jgi:hypothetical protein
MRRISLVVSWIERAGLLCLVLAIGYAGWVYSHRTDWPEVEAQAPVLIPEVGPFFAEASNGEAPAMPEVDRDLFSPVIAKVPVAAPAAVDHLQLPAQFKVVGLVLDGKAQLILEDTQLKRTYFITQARGDGGFTLVRGDQGRVEVNYQGQTYIISAGDRDGI